MRACVRTQDAISCARQMETGKGTHRRQVGQDGDDQERNGVERANRDEPQPADRLRAAHFRLTPAQVLPYLQNTRSVTWTCVQEVGGRTMSLGFGANVTIEPFGFLCLSTLATI